MSQRQCAKSTMKRRNGLMSEKTEEKEVDETWAPEGYIAVDMQSGSCKGCAFDERYTCAAKNEEKDCVGFDRPDGHDVIFIKEGDDVPEH